MVSEAYRKSKTVIEVDGYVSIRLFAYYPTSVEVISSGYAIYSLRRSYALVSTVA